MRPASALTPALALDYVRELSTDVLAGVALGAAGERLAGPEELAAPARALLAAAGAAAELEAATAGGCVCAVRSERHALVVACGRVRAARRSSRRDLRTALAELEGRAAAGRAAGAAARAGDAALQRAAEALISAAQRGIRRADGRVGARLPDQKSRKLRAFRRIPRPRAKTASGALVSVAPTPDHKGRREDA